MKKVLVSLAIGEQYAELDRTTAPFREAWAARHGWDCETIRELPSWFLERHSSEGAKSASTLYKLLIPGAFAAYDLVAFCDLDAFMNPDAPCLTTYEDQIPEGGFAAANDLPFEKRAVCFPEWEVDYYVELEKRIGAKLDLPSREQSMNSGLMVYRPSEVADRWQKLADMDTPLNEENRLNVFEVQQGKCFFLPLEWNVVWQYYVREHFPYLQRPARHNRWIHRANTLIARTIGAPIERRHLMATLAKSHVLHLAFQRAKAGLLRGVDPGRIALARDNRLPRLRLYL
jgi:hypothetical protein